MNGRMDFRDWPQFEWLQVKRFFTENNITWAGPEIRILLVKNAQLDEQGFSGTTIEEAKNTLMVFPKIVKNGKFVMETKFGTVDFGLNIVFIGSNFEIIKTDDMKAVDDYSDTPKGTIMAVEWIKDSEIDIQTLLPLLKYLKENHFLDFREN